ncbi:Lsr2 [Streptomyces noursei ATCC 11455]|uniref:Lsr2 family protein n=1 Tax=Streptomyces noursei TaxID=1971 RepID=UPI00081D0216|nr:Lsr2 [Streptomyces noursei ATCC 11455]
MAVKETIQVDESQKDEPGVQEVITPVPVGNQIVKKATYWQSILQDDLNPEVTDGVTPIRFAVPEMVDEEYETEESNEDGTKKIAIRQVLDLKWYEADLGAENVAKLQEAVKPFVAVARASEAPTSKPARKKRAAK